MDETILFADLAGFTALTEAQGDEPAVEVATRFAQLTESLLADRSVLIKTIGDAVMLAGTDPVVARRRALILSARWRVVVEQLVGGGRWSRGRLASAPVQLRARRS